MKSEHDLILERNARIEAVDSEVATEIEVRRLAIKDEISKNGPGAMTESETASVDHAMSERRSRIQREHQILGLSADTADLLSREMIEQQRSTITAEVLAGARVERERDAIRREKYWYAINPGVPFKGIVAPIHAPRIDAQQADAIQRAHEAVKAQLENHSPMDKLMKDVRRVQNQ